MNNTWLEKSLCTISDGKINHHDWIIECTTLEEMDILTLPDDWVDNEESAKLWRERSAGININPGEYYHSIRMFEVFKDKPGKEVVYNIPSKKFSIESVETREEEIVLFKLLHNIRNNYGN